MSLSASITVSRTSSLPTSTSFTSSYSFNPPRPSGTANPNTNEPEGGGLQFSGILGGVGAGFLLIVLLILVWQHKRRKEVARRRQNARTDVEAGGVPLENLDPDALPSYKQHKAGRLIKDEDVPPPSFDLVVSATPSRASSPSPSTVPSTYVPSLQDQSPAQGFLEPRASTSSHGHGHGRRLSASSFASSFGPMGVVVEDEEETRYKELKRAHRLLGELKELVAPIGDAEPEGDEAERRQLDHVELRRIYDGLLSYTPTTSQSAPLAGPSSSSRSPSPSPLTHDERVARITPILSRLLDLGPPSPPSSPGQSQAQPETEASQKQRKLCITELKVMLDGHGANFVHVFDAQQSDVPLSARLSTSSVSDVRLESPSGESRPVVVVSPALESEEGEGENGEAKGKGKERAKERSPTIDSLPPSYTITVVGPSGSS